MSSFRLTIDSTIYENDQAVTINNVRPENNISSLEFVINDYKSQNYSDIIQKFSQLTLELSNKNSGYTTTFIGEVVALQPSNNPECLTVYCEGYERALKQTHCNGSFGIESLNPTKYTPREIIQDLIAYYVEFSLDTANPTNWTINDTDTYVDNIHSGLNVTNLTSKYLDNFTVLNRLAEIVNSYAQTLGTPEPGIHWFAAPSGTNPLFYVKEIGDNHSSGGWPKYYGGTQAEATVTQGIDIKDRQFHQSIHDYANNVILACALRKPASDYWTEDAETNAIWTIDDGDITLSDDAANKVVGANSLKLTIPANQIDEIYFDFANNLDLTNIGSQDSIPTIGLYARRTSTPGWAANVALRLYTTRDTHHFNMQLYNQASDTAWMPNGNKWYGITIPIGPFYKNFGGMPDKQWSELGTPDWTDIDGVQIMFNNTAYADVNYFWIDDLHLNGKIIREARDAGAITGGEKERQSFLRLDTAVDDTCNTTNNTGTAARLAASELFKRSQFKTTDAHKGLTGIITLPMKEDMLPGQQLHVHDGKKTDSTYRYDLDMRIKSLTHIVSTQGYFTKCTLTSDLWNSHTFDTPSAWGIMKANAGALGHAEARDLKASGVDFNIPRLTWDPTA